MITQLEHVDIAIVGGGFAAMEAALAVIDEMPEAEIALLSKERIGLSGASLVSMSVHRYAPDESGLREAYRRNFLASSQGIGDPSLLEALINEGSRSLDALEAKGMPFEFKEMSAANGKSYRCIAHSKQKYGRQITEPMRHYLLKQPRVKALEGYMALDVLTHSGQIIGILAEKKGHFYVQPARAVVLACGGSAFMYKNTSSTRDLTGDGYALALRAGLALQDMEFVQFYPYRIVNPCAANIFPDVFDHGAVFLNEKGERFMDSFPKKELENRDVLSRMMYAQKEVIFDIRAADQEYIRRECSLIYDLSRKHNTQTFHVKPVTHFIMGGIPLRLDCGTDLPGLFCCGEVTGGLHGANRIAGSALTECAVFGARAGKAAAAFAVNNSTDLVSIGAQLIRLADKEVLAFCPASGQDDAEEIISGLREIMWEKAALIRKENSLLDAVQAVERLNKQLMNQKPLNLRTWLEARNMLLVSGAVLASAIMRRESRGAHFREDYPDMDESFNGNIMYQNGKAKFIKRDWGDLINGCY